MVKGAKKAKNVARRIRGVHRIEPQIRPIFVERSMITRSERRLMERHGIRECSVRIERNLPTIATAWLNRPRTPPPPVQPVPFSNCLLQPRDRRARLASVASCNNLFQVDGSVLEVGYDRLERVNYDAEDAEHTGVNNSNALQANQNEPTSEAVADVVDLGMVDGLNNVGDWDAEIENSFEEELGIPENYERIAVDSDTNAGTSDGGNSSSTGSTASVALVASVLQPSRAHNNSIIGAKGAKGENFSIVFNYSDDSDEDDASNSRNEHDGVELVVSQEIATSEQTNQGQSIEEAGEGVASQEIATSEQTNKEAVAAVASQENTEKANQGQSIDSNINISIDSAQAARDNADKCGSYGRSHFFDPFRRTNNLPFSIRGRRRSISVFPTITEIPDEENTKEQEEKGEH